MAPSNAPRGYVLGGGIAGICAAFALRDKGFDVELLESRRWLGGRAFTLPQKGAASGESGGESEGDPDAETKTWQIPTGAAMPTDNGPHVMMGAYRDTRAMLRRIGTEGRFAVPKALQLAYRSATGQAARMKLLPLPVPLALPLALPSLGLGIGGTLRALWGLGAVLRRPKPTQSLAQWLRKNRQLGTPDAYLWTPMCRAILNAEPDQVEARLFLATLRQAFMGSAARAAIWVPREGWGRIIGDAAMTRMAEEGIRVSTGCRITGLEGAKTVQRIQLASGETRDLERLDVVVSALPWFAWRKLAGAPAAGEELQAAPIVNLYMEMESDGDAPPDEGLLTSLVDGDPFHFLYRSPGDARRRFALIAGAAQPLAGLSVDEIEQRARQQLSRHYPGFRPGASGQARVVKENLATLVPAPGGVPRPPAGRYQRDNLWLCGDWVDTGLPSTLEGAARSARLALADLPPAAH